MFISIFVFALIVIIAFQMSYMKFLHDEIERQREDKKLDKKIIGESAKKINDLSERINILFDEKTNIERENERLNKILTKKVKQCQIQYDECEKLLLQIEELEKGNPFISENQDLKQQNEYLLRKSATDKITLELTIKQLEKEKAELVERKENERLYYNQQKSKLREQLEHCKQSKKEM